MSDQDELAIIRVINRYAVAIDARRWDLFDTIFTEDVKLEYPSRNWYDLATFKTDFENQHAGYDATQHMMLNHLVEATGDDAGAMTYCSFRLIIRGTEGGDFLEGSAWYDDSLRRTANGWRISRRHCRILWTDGNPRVTRGKTPELTAMRVEAAQGNIAYLKAFDAKQR